MKFMKFIWSRICCDCSSAQGIFNVRCYGAKGDGQTDDLEAILAARDAVNAARGGVLFFPRGSFLVSNTIELGSGTTVLGLGAASVLKAKPGVASFNMMFVRNSSDVRVLDLILDGNRTKTTPPANSKNQNIGCGFFGEPDDRGQTGLSIKNIIVRNHHGSGIRIKGPSNSDDLYQLNANEVEVVGCQILDCSGRGINLNRVTQARIAGNAITSCVQVGIQLVLSRAAVIKENVIHKTVQKPGTKGGHGIKSDNSFDIVIADNVASENERWGIVASGGSGNWPPRHPMSQRCIVAHNVCRANDAGGITIDPTAVDHSEIIQDSFATVASNICAANQGHGIHTTHAGYLTVRGNICDGNKKAGIAIISSRYAVVADNVLTGNGNYGVGFWADTDVRGVGHHLLGGNVYENNKSGETFVARHHPAIRGLQDRWSRGGTLGLPLPVKSTANDPTNPVEGLLYLNTADNKLRVYADGTWHTLQTTTGASWEED
ncbi:MAG: right-handed parallel beta-helix repeat-containing protein [Desulfobacterales bacterium]|nr:right-handed parallel beta-helix repeat-containing protein [Desulfobacterales bacterium]